MEDTLIEELQKKEYVRYGDSIKLYATSQVIKEHLKELSKDKSAGKTAATGETGGYLGVYEKGDGSARVAVPPIGASAEGKFTVSVFRVEDPNSLHQDGEIVRYSDVISLVDNLGLVWNNKCGTTLASFFEGYLGPKPRGSAGEVFLSFAKNGHDGKPVVYGDVAVYVDVESSRRTRTSYNNRLTNFKSTSSKVQGGYVCSDGYGYDLPITIHRHSGPPVRAYKNPALLSRRRSLSLRNMGNKGAMFVPPEIIRVSVRRKDRPDENGSANLDTMIEKPMYGKAIKLYNVRPDDELVIHLDQLNSPAVLRAEHLFNAAESAATSGSTDPIQVDIACTAPVWDKKGCAETPAATKKAAPKVSDSGSRIIELTSLEMLIEQDLAVLKRAFESDMPGGEAALYADSVAQESSSGIDKLEVLIALQKVVLLYLLLAVVIPRSLWQVLLLVGDLLEPIGQASATNKSLALLQRIATSLVVDFGIRVEDGRAMITEEMRSAETTTLKTQLFALVLCAWFGLLTPSFAMAGPSKTKKERAARSSNEVANWLIRFQVPEHAWDSCVGGGADGSTRTLGEDVDDEDGEDQVEDEEGVCYMNGVRLSGAWAAAGLDENGIPKHPAWPRFLAAAKGNLEEGKNRWIETVLWRELYKVDTYLSEPHPFFSVLKTHVPSYYYGRSKEGFPVYIDRPGRVKVKAIKKAGADIADLQFNFIYSTEFLWNLLEPSEKGRTISILDLDGVGVSDLMGEVLGFVKKTIKISGDHYPERSRKIFLVNCPWYFNRIWAVIKPFIDKSTLDKVELMGSGSAFDKSKLLEMIDADQLPVEYGGSNKTPLGESYEERMLRSHVYRVLVEKGVALKNDEGNPVDGSPENLKNLIDDTIKTGVSGLK